MNPAPMPYVSALYAGLVALLLIVLAGVVSRLRRKLEIGIGDGGSKELQRAIRAHANTVEWGVPGIVLLLIAELNRASPAIVHLCGIAIVAGRALHAYGLSHFSGPSFGRMTGSLLSWGAVIVLAVWNLWAFLRVAGLR